MRAETSNGFRFCSQELERERVLNRRGRPCSAAEPLIHCATVIKAWFPGFPPLLTPSERLSPWTGGGTSPAPPPVCPDTLALRIQRAPTRKGAVWISLLCLATISPAGRRGSWGRSSHRGTRSSGTGGTASVGGPQGASEGAEPPVGNEQVSDHNIPCTT